jgi:CDP-paratose 2-epimerase
MIIVTGSAGLIGSEAVRLFAGKGADVVGIDKDMRQTFFGPKGTTHPVRQVLERSVPRYRHLDADIRDESTIENLFRYHRGAISAVVHAAAQPSHDWAQTAPIVDFTVNANGTLLLLEMTRRYCRDAVLFFSAPTKYMATRRTGFLSSSIKRDGSLTLHMHFAEYGIDETMNIDNCLHSLFGVSKMAADLLVQEYGRYFGLKSACFRCGCLTGPAHVGVELHGFLSYLMKRAASGRPYTVFGYKGKRVRDNIHSRDLVEADGVAPCFRSQATCWRGQRTITRTSR